MMKTLRILPLLAVVLWPCPNWASAQPGTYIVTDTAIISKRLYLPMRAYGTCDQPFGISYGDFNNDRRSDLVTVCKRSNEFCIHIADTGGVFKPGRRFPTGQEPRSVCVADVNKDGKEDIIIASLADGKVNVHLANTTNGFDPKKSFTTGQLPHDVKALDVNRDGLPDLITVGNTDNSLNIHINRGNGSFAPKVTLPTGHQPRRIAEGDLNGDGQPDLAIGCDDDNIDLYINQGGGTFGNRTKVMCPGAVWGLVLADVNQDEKLDLVACTYSTAQICILMGQGGGRFAAPVCRPSGNYNFEVMAIDMDNDGDMDVVTCSTRDNCLNLHLNDGEGRFPTRECMQSGAYNTCLAAVDVDNDHDMDIVTTSTGDNNINVHRNTPQTRPLPWMVAHRGRVFDEQTNQPLVGVVSFLSVPGNVAIAAVRTDNSGRYEVKLPIRASYTMVVGAVDYPRTTRPVRVPRRDSIPETMRTGGVTIDVPLKKLTGALVYGVVRDNSTQQPVPGITVILKNMATGKLDSVKTDVDGKYSQFVPFGSYLCTTNNIRYHPSSGGFGVERSDAATGKRWDIIVGFNLEAVTACIEGAVTDAKTGKAIPNALVRILTPQGVKLKVVKADAKGRYTACVPMGSLMVDVNHQGYFFEVSNIELNEEHKESALQHNVRLRPLELHSMVVLANIYFDVDKTTLRPESMEELTRIKYVLTQNPALKVEISGHTDSDGGQAHNLQLSQRRAEAVTNYLAVKGVDPTRMVAKGYGQSRPVAPNDTEENKQKNRRTEFKIISTTWQPETRVAGSGEDWGVWDTGGGSAGNNNLDPNQGTTGNWGDTDWNGGGNQPATQPLW